MISGGNRRAGEKPATVPLRPPRISFILNCILMYCHMKRVERYWNRESERS
jgi:hypothetical protein